MNDARIFAFGPFRLIPERQLLLEGDTAVRIGGRALDLLIALVERPGELISKHELIAFAWPTTTVEESNLKVNMAALRRALNDDAGAARYIATVAGRGYRFIAPIRMQELPAHHDGTAPRLQPAWYELDQPRFVSILAPGRAGQDADAPQTTRIRFVDLPPLAEYVAVPAPAPTLPSAIDERAMPAPQVSAAACDGAIDLGIVLDGEITLMLDDANVPLKPGSVVVQRGIDHAWANHSGSPCRILFVRLDSGQDMGRLGALGGW
ncbi:DNA-binding winged helix-turn-helix (wHTH) protein [Sphingomonas zeicaulis]|uniref:winged helix-turn-helix domain-containing protein n=1 Tax=Sphingomonas zeicaulis TaxID=1632740 RepID=UPI003D24A335